VAPELLFNQGVALDVSDAEGSVTTWAVAGAFGLPRIYNAPGRRVTSGREGDFGLAASVPAEALATGAAADIAPGADCGADPRLPLVARSPRTNAPLPPRGRTASAELVVVGAASVGAGLVPGSAAGEVEATRVGARPPGT
jgi:hypothetical protein